jgi:hypothetical protein
VIVRTWGAVVLRPYTIQPNSKILAYYGRVFVELTRHSSKIVHVERIFLPEQTPDSHVETRFEPDGSGAMMTMRMTMPGEATRAAMLSTGMERGMESSYERLEKMIPMRMEIGK